MKEREELAEKDRQAHVKQEQEQIEADLKRSKASVTEFSSALQSRLDDIPEPIHLAGCQSLTKGRFLHELVLLLYLEYSRS